MATKIEYDGPAGLANGDVARETGESALLTPGKVYEVSAELADRLLASSEFFKRPKPKRRTTSSDATSDDAVDEQDAADEDDAALETTTDGGAADVDTATDEGVTTE